MSKYAKYSLNQLMHWFDSLIPEFRLVLYVLSLYAIFMTWGFLQEKITTTSYFRKIPTEDEEISKQWTYPMMLNTCMTATASITAFIVEYNISEPKKSSAAVIPFTCFWKISLSAAMASPIGYFSLKYISYPMMILTKSCKPVPVMFMGVLFYRKTYMWYKYASVVLLCGGISLFTASKSTHSGSNSSESNDSIYLQLFGLFLVLFNLCLDGITSNEQDHIFSNFQPTSLQMMKYTNGWQAIYLGLYLLLDALFRGRNSDFVNSLYMVAFYHGVFRDILIFCLCSCVGQLILFGLIKEFGSLVWITVAVSRQLFTILLSVFIFGHHINGWQWLGIIFVFGGLSLEIGLTYMSKPSVEGPKQSVKGLSTLGSDPNDSVDLESISAPTSSKKRSKYD